MDTNNTQDGRQQKSEAILGSIGNFFKTFKIGSLLNLCGIKKTKGFSPLMILTTIFQLTFHGDNFFRGIVLNESSPFGKDVAYEFLKQPCFNWRKLLLSISSQISLYISTLTKETRENVLIFDDSPYDRSRSKKVELLANVYDHADNKYIKGYRLLTACWSDGYSTIPLDFVLLSSENKKNRICDITKPLDKRCVGYKRRLEAMTKATECLAPMAERISKHRIKFDYILMDSWFSWPKVISELFPNAHVITMVKKTSKVKYRFENQELDVKAIYQRVKKRPGRSKILADAVVTLSSGIPAKLVFVRDRHKSDWLALLCTNTEVANEKIVSLYGRRWDIEVFFKMAKHHLKLTKEIQARDYDSLIAHTSIVFMRYQFLAYEQRLRTDNRTFGHLFYVCCEEVKDITFLEALQRMLTLAIETIRKITDLGDDMIQQLIDAIMGRAIDFFNLGDNNFQRS